MIKISKKPGPDIGYDYDKLPKYTKEELKLFGEQRRREYNARKAEEERERAWTHIGYRIGEWIIEEIRTIPIIEIPGDILADLLDELDNSI